MNTQLLASYYGGSQSYGLETLTSDLDTRQIVCNTAPSYILGLDRFEVSVSVTKTVDSVVSELRHFITGLMTASMQAIECLYLPKDKFLVLDQKFDDLILQAKNRLISPLRLYECIRGYSYSEQKLANGERVGKLGGKRQAQLSKLGFSPKNFVNLFRLLFAATKFFELGEFPVEPRRISPMFHGFLLDVKCCPENYCKEELNCITTIMQETFESSYAKHKDAITKEFSYDIDYANNVLLEFYYPHLQLWRDDKQN